MKQESAKPFDRDNSNPNNGILNHVPYTPNQDSYRGDKRTKRKRETSAFEDPKGSKDSIAKRQKTVEPIRALTRKNLKLLENSMASVPRSESVMTLSKQDEYTEPSSVPSAPSTSGRSLPANSPRFDLELKALNVDYTEREKPAPGELARFRGIMEAKRDSPEPDRDLFHATRLDVMTENEASITHDMSPLLLVQRGLPINNDRTSNLLYRKKAQWHQWGSVRPSCLPVPKPDLCISYRNSAFTSEERGQMVSPYYDTAGFAPFLICEIKTALQGDEIADRHNRNNVIRVLKADFALQKKLSRESAMERKVRVFTTTHNTRTQWYHAWYYVIGDDGNPKWCCYRIKRISIDSPEENGFETTRACFLNLCEHFNSEVLPKLKADLAEASKQKSSGIDGSPFQPVLTPNFAPQVQLDTASHETPAPATPTSDDGHDSGGDLQPASKRAKGATPPAPRWGNPKTAEGKSRGSNRGKGRGGMLLDRHGQSTVMSIPGWDIWRRGRQRMTRRSSRIRSLVKCQLIDPFYPLPPPPAPSRDLLRLHPNTPSPFPQGAAGEGYMGPSLRYYRLGVVKVK